MNTMARRITSASLSRLVSITVLALLSCVSAAAFDGQSKTETGAAAQPAGPDATSDITGRDSKSATRNATAQPVDASGQRSKEAKAVTLSAKEKFNYFVMRSFLSPTPYATAIAAGAVGEWADDDHHHHAKPGDFSADAATRAARSFAFGATANFFEKFAFASLFKQDPRYYKSEKTGAGARIGYAISRLFVTRNDRGASQFNASFVAGGLTAAGLSNAWEREERQTAGETMKRFGLHVGFAAVANILHEFIGKH